MSNHTPRIGFWAALVATIAGLGFILAMTSFDGQHVLEIGCGDGRVTWR